MNLLYQKLSEKYQNSEELFEILKKYELDEILLNAITAIEKKMDNTDYSSIVSLSGVILGNVNTKISKIDNDKDKRKIEYLISDIFLVYIAQLTEQERPSIILEIAKSLRNTCELNGYDYEKLEKYINLEKHEILLPVPKIKNVYYDWRGSDSDLDELARDLYSKKYIYSVREFKNLFKENKEFRQIRFNREYQDEIIIFFHALKVLELVKPKGKNNSGHFTPFVTFAVDNENVYFIEKAINKEHERLKKNKEKYQKTLEKTKKMLSFIKIESR